MAKIKNFTDWKAAVRAEYDRLDAVMEWLSNEGEQRRLTYYYLWENATYCESASDMLEWLKTQEGMNRYEKAALESHFAETPLARLRDIARQEA